MLLCGVLTVLGDDTALRRVHPDTTQHSPVDPGTVLRIFLVSCASIGKVVLVAGGGVYLTKKGIITAASKGTLSKLSSQLCLPCLLFSLF